MIKRFFITWAKAFLVVSATAILMSGAGFLAVTLAEAAPNLAPIVLVVAVLLAASGLWAALYEA